MGEVAKPGTIIVPDGKMNILEALIQSGDLTIFARRDNILVIREQNGKREFGRVDLASNNIFESPYFNMQQNDFIYVEPDKTKFIANDVITNRNIRNFGLALTIFSTVLLLVTLFN
jgi:polysaccharide export outer membrane protein